MNEYTDSITNDNREYSEATSHAHISKHRLLCYILKLDAVMSKNKGEHRFTFIINATIFLLFVHHCYAQKPDNNVFNSNDF